MLSWYFIAVSSWLLSPKINGFNKSQSNFSVLFFSPAICVSGHRNMVPSMISPTCARKHTTFGCWIPRMHSLCLESVRQWAVHKPRAAPSLVFLYQVLSNVRMSYQSTRCHLILIACQAIPLSQFPPPQCRAVSRAPDSLEQLEL